MQTFLVLLIFVLAVVYLLKKFVWESVFQPKKKITKSLDGNNTKCGNTDCGCH